MIHLHRLVPLLRMTSASANFLIDTFWALIKLNGSLIFELVDSEDSDDFKKIRFLYFLLIVIFGPVSPFPFNYISVIAVSSVPILRFCEDSAELVGEYFKKCKTPISIGGAFRRSATTGNLLAVFDPKLGFYPITICDFNKLDDSFCPDHVSIIHCVEMRRNFFVDTYRFVVWRVSTLTGERKRLHDSASFRRGDSGVVKCFQSAGVIFIKIQMSEMKDLLFVYDTRFQRSAKYIMSREEDDILSISCVDRLWSENRFVDGWKIRSIAAESNWIWYEEKIDNDEIEENGDVEKSDDEDDSEIEYNGSWRARLVVNYFDLRQSASAMGRNELDIGNFFRQEPTLKMVHNSVGLFVVFAIDAHYRNNGPAIVYYNSYALCSNLDEALRFDRSVSMYFQNGKPFDQYSDLLVLSDRQAIVYDSRRNSVRRIEFDAATLKYLSARAIFRSKSILKESSDYNRFLASWRIA